MHLKLRFPLRHPLFPDWPLTPVRTARGPSAAVSGTYRDLMRAASAGVSAQRAVFVMHRPDTPFLDDNDREVLWQAYQVPVFACLLDGDGRLVGYECEAQDGLHIGGPCPEDSRKMMISNEDSVLGYQIPLDRTMLENSPCECGRPGQRLRLPGRFSAALEEELAQPA